MEDILSHVMPHIKAALPLADGAIELGPDDSPVLHDLGNGLIVMYAADQGDHFEFVQNRHTEKARISPEGLHEAAVRNLSAFAEGQLRIAPHGNIFALFLDGNFEASVLLLDAVWEGPLAEYAPNGFIAAVAARDILAFADRRSRKGVKELREVVGRAFPGCDHPISDGLFRREAGRWVRHDG
jgi:uncharacterized protein YtpQ (UPF0354 family)